MSTNVTTAPAQGAEQGQSQGNVNDNGLGSAMDSWGENNPTITTPAETPSTTPPPAQQQSQPTTPTTPAQQQGAPVTPTAPTTPAATDSAAMIRAAVDATAQAMLKQTAAQQRSVATPPKEMTDAEFNAHYGIPTVDGPALERLFDKDAAKGAQVLQEILAANRTASLKMAQDLIQLQVSQHVERFQPRVAAMEKFISEQTERQSSDRFYTAYPDLKPEADMVQEILNAVNARVSSGQLKFTDEKQAFQFVADATNNRIAAMRSKYGGGATQNGGTPSAGGQQTPPAPSRQMANLTSSARPGGAPSKPSSELDKVMSSWDQTPD